MKRGWQPRSVRLAAVNARIVERIRQHNTTQRLGFKFPIVAGTATSLPADRKSAGTSNRGRPACPDLSAD